MSQACRDALRPRRRAPRMMTGTCANQHILEEACPQLREVVLAVGLESARASSPCPAAGCGPRPGGGSLDRRGARHRGAAGAFLDSQQEGGPATLGRRGHGRTSLLPSLLVVQQLRLV